MRGRPESASTSPPSGTGPAHMRRLSEPTEMISTEETTNRRSMFERNWSSSALGADSQQGLHPSTAGYTPAWSTPDNMVEFQESWTNANFGNFLGVASSNSMFALPVNNPIEHPALLSGNGRQTSSPKVDSAGISSAIHDAARITDWEKVSELCKTHPELAKYSGRDRWTALHHACNRRCPYPHVVKALIGAYPEALLQEEEKGWLPLHYACRFKAPKEVVRLLLYMYPEKGRRTVPKRDRLGRTPLYYAIRYEAPSGVVGLLLEVDPSAVLEEDQNEDSPLALVWDSWAEKLEGKRIVQSFLPGGFPEPEDTSVEERAELLRARLRKEPKLYKRWHKVNMLLKSAFGFPVEDDNDSDEATDEPGAQQQQPQQPQRTWRIVHATAAVKCHLHLFLLACALHPEQARELDQNDLRRPGDRCPEGGLSGQTALHLAASSNAGGEPGKYVIISLLSLYREAAQVQDAIDGSLPLHRMVENPRKADWPQHAAILYHFYQRAVQIHDHNGRLPLHRAAAAIVHVERDHDDHDEAAERSLIIQLVRAFPQAALSADHSGCLPLHLIAANGQVWDEDVESVYNANRNAVHVRAGPSMHDRLALHMAAANVRARESLVHRLVQLHPRGASLVDRQGKFPLHLCCEIGKEWKDGTRCVYEAFPNAVREAETNTRGWLPLHMAAACPDSSGSLIDRLVELHTEAACIADGQGQYPLHLACRAGKNWLGGMERLIQANPNAVSAADNRGVLPFHLVALRYCYQPTMVEEEEVIEQVEGYKRKKQKEAEDADALDVMFNLLRSDPTVLSLSCCLE